MEAIMGLLGMICIGFLIFHVIDEWFFNGLLSRLLEKYLLK